MKKEWPKYPAAHSRCEFVAALKLWDICKDKPDRWVKMFLRNMARQSQDKIRRIVCLPLVLIVGLSGCHRDKGRVLKADPSINGVPGEIHNDSLEPLMTSCGTAIETHITIYKDGKYRAEEWEMR